MTQSSVTADFDQAADVGVVAGVRMLQHIFAIKTPEQLYGVSLTQALQFGQCEQAAGAFVLAGFVHDGIGTTAIGKSGGGVIVVSVHISDHIFKISLAFFQAIHQGLENHGVLHGRSTHSAIAGGVWHVPCRQW